MKTKYFFLLFLLKTFLFQSQNETSKWHFGANVALDFLSNPVSQQASSSMSSYEGCASIADANGNLLFYSNGSIVWDASHNVMSNGSGLLGNESASQGTLILKQPGINSNYYLFTMDDWMGNNGLCFSIIDMSLAAGMGSVTVKNNLLLNTKPSEMICAVKHCNNSDIWIIGLDPSNNCFFSFLLDNVGLSTVPVTSPLIIPQANLIIGQLKASPQGNRICSALTYSNNRTSVNIYEFNSQSGIVSNEITLHDTLIQSFLNTKFRYYGCEFSQDGSKLYASRFSGRINQWNLCLQNVNLLQQSRIVLSDTNLAQPRSMQLAPDGKIYITAWEQLHLGVINNPNLPGQACNYVSNGLSINTGTLYGGLPNFPAYYFFKKDPQAFTNTITCRTVTFSPASSSCATTPSALSYSWNFGDLQSPAQNTSALQSPVHTYNAPGNYSVSLIRQFACYADTIAQTITVANITPSLTVVTPTYVCINEIRTLYANGAQNYSWSNNQSGSQITVSLSASGIYTFAVTGSNTSGCNATETFSIFAHTCVGLNKNNGLSQIKIFPNPCQTNLRIEAENAMEIKIYNQLGSLILVKDIMVGINEIDLQKLPSALYYLKAENKQGEPTYYKVWKTN